jgi:hypothetical protein
VLLPIVVVLVLLLAVTGAAVAFALRLDRRQQVERVELERRFRELCNDLGAHEEAGAFALALNEQPFVLRLSSARSTANGLELETAVEAKDAPPSLRPDARPVIEGRPWVLLRRETWADRLGKRLRINREVQTGDEAFDAAVYLESDASDADVARVLGAPEVRRGILQLFSRGCRQVSINDGGSRLSVTHDAGAPLDASAVRAACQDCSIIAAGLPSFQGQARRPPLWVVGPVAMVASAVAAFGGFIAASNAYADYYPLGREAIWAGVIVGLGVWLVVMPLVGALVRGRSGSFRVFVACFFLLLAALPLAGVGLAVGLNGYLDGAQATELRARVTSRWSETLKSGTSYYVRIEGLQNERATVVVPVTSDVYAAVREGEDVVVRVGRGRFGWEWLQGIRKPEGGV